MVGKTCTKSMRYSIYSRRCFVTGEYCSKQMNVQRERKKLHEKFEINAFVVMNFSDMSNVVYKWKLKSFIQSLHQYLWINKETKELLCAPEKIYTPEGNSENEEDEANKWKRITKINVIRADSNPASNYVICNRICQQLQIADLIIVDVYVENTNVFYEFGLAVALGKMILPICYANSFYEIKIPYDVETIREKKPDFNEELMNHIGCYPWRKRLFEYYGLRFRKVNSNVEYKEFDKVTQDEFKFEDIQYNRFPYDALIDSPENSNSSRQEEKVGYKLYERLKHSYNNFDSSGKGSKESGDDSEGRYNTLLVYTMDGFLNEDYAGRCIINFYKNITEYFRKEWCFCGDRVDILGQTNSIFDNPKDTRTGQVLGYNVEDIIRIGMNEATYVAQTEKIKTGDFLKSEVSVPLWQQAWASETIRFIKEHIRNRCIPVYPDNPIYVKQVQKGIQKGILDETDKDCFCLFHVMVSTLKYTNEVVVDLSKNSVQALFWLGAAHGSGVNAITVKHILTKEEKETRPPKESKEDRNIFDVAGLWTAVLRSNDTEGFYQQLKLAQIGIEQHTKLMLHNMDSYKKELIEQFYETPVPSESERKAKIDDIFNRKEMQETDALESYYRNRFWRRMHRYNQLRIYLPEKDGITENGEPKLLVVKWDVDAMANLSHYLSKRKIIGKYYIETLRVDKVKKSAVDQNFICIGRNAQPFSDSNHTMSLAEYILKKNKRASIG